MSGTTLLPRWVASSVEYKFPYVMTFGETGPDLLGVLGLGPESRRASRFARRNPWWGTAGFGVSCSGLGLGAGEGIVARFVAADGLGRALQLAPPAWRQDKSPGLHRGVRCECGIRVARGRLLAAWRAGCVTP